MTKHRFHRHVIADIPNNALTRWLVARMNKRMKKHQSMWCFAIRYRSPKAGAPKYLWGLRQRHAKRFSLYLRERPQATIALLTERKARETRMQEMH